MTLKFIQPDYTTKTTSGGDFTAYCAEIEAALAVLGASSLGQFAPYASTPCDLKVRVMAGALRESFNLGGNDQTLTLAAQATGDFTAPTLYPRIDRVALRIDSGALRVVTGTEAAVPVAPAYPDGVIPLCQVSLAVGQTAITNAHITDERGYAARDLALTAEVMGAALIPTMTDYTVPSGTASADTEFSATYRAWKAFDNIDANYWDSTATAMPHWLKYAFPSAKTVRCYSVTAPSAITISPKSWTFEAWDGAAWVVLDTRTMQDDFAAYETRWYEFSNSTAYTDYRINVTANQGATQVGITGLQMYESAGAYAIPDNAYTDAVGYKIFDVAGIYKFPKPADANFYRLTIIGPGGGCGGKYTNGGSTTDWLGGWAEAGRFCRELSALPKIW